MADVGVRRCGLVDVPFLAAMRHTWAEERVGQQIADDLFEARFGEWFEAETDHRASWLAELDEHPYADEEGFDRLVLNPSERSVGFLRAGRLHNATTLMVRPGR